MARNGMTDRRARRTHALLHASLSELILERGYDRITVQHILDRADVGRSTFYSHYPSKDELLRSRMDELVAAVRPCISTSAQNAEEHRSTPLLSPLKPLFEQVDDNRALCRAVLAGGRATDLAFRSGHIMLRDLLTTHLRSCLTVTDQGRLDLAVTFMLSAKYGVLVRWLETDPKRSAASVYDDFDQLATQGIRAYLQCAGPA